MSAIHTLHILNKAPGHPRWAACLGALKPGDALLLIESAVLGMATNQVSQRDVSIFALEPDLMARGLRERGTEATLVGYPGMVELTTKAQSVISW